MGILRRWPGEATLVLLGNLNQLPPERRQPALPIATQIKPLQIPGDRRFSGTAVVLDYLEDGFAQRPGLGKFGKAPAGGAPVRRLQY